MNHSGFGLGIVLGEPTGFSAKLWTGGNNAIVGGLAWSLADNGGMHLHADYLWHNTNIINPGRNDIPFYYGLGGRIQTHDFGDDSIGVRFPLGFGYQIKNAPFDLFVEIVPVMDLAPDTDFELSAAIGGRIFF